MSTSTSSLRRLGNAYGAPPMTAPDSLIVLDALSTAMAAEAQNYRRAIRLGASAIERSLLLESLAQMVAQARTMEDALTRPHTHEPPSGSLAGHPGRRLARTLTGEP